MICEAKNIPFPAILILSLFLLNVLPSAEVWLQANYQPNMRRRHERSRD